jgi:hypothetical protein
MKNSINCLLIGIFLVTVLLSGSLWAADTAKITVLNPRGIQPPIRLIPMAPRLDTLEGKTIYVVDTKYPLTKPFVQEVYNVLKERYPKTNWVFRDKIGSYFDDDPKLWAEIKKRATQWLSTALKHMPPAVVGHCISVEKLGVPTAPIIRVSDC